MNFEIGKSKMNRSWFKITFFILLSIYLLKGLITFLSLSNGNSFLKIKTKFYNIKRTLINLDSVDKHLKQLEDIYEQNVREFYRVYNNYYKPRLTDAFHTPSSRPLNLNGIQPACANRPYLLIQVHSAPLNVKKRLAIRYSWGAEYNDFNTIDMNKSKHNVKRAFQTVFVIGRSEIHGVNKVLLEESKAYKDVLITNFTDSYRGLSRKTVYALKWASNNCLPMYMLKTDDDCYVNVKSIIQYLTNNFNPENLYTGRIQWFMPANRDTTSKFYVSEEDYPHFLLPPYASGGGYLFSGAVIPRLVNASKHIKLIPNEDANFGILMHSLNIKPVENIRILPYIYCNESIWIRPTCDFLSPFVVHGVKNYAQIWVHHNVKILNKISGICKQSLKYRRHLRPPLCCPTDNS